MCRFHAITIGVLFLAASSLNTPAVELISADDPLAGWKPYNGKEFPGATVSLVVDEAESREGSPALKLHGDFTGGGAYVEAGYVLDPAVDIQNLLLWIKQPGADELAMRVIDATGQCHQMKLAIRQTDDWQQVRFPLARYFEMMGTPQAVAGVSQYQKWDGAKDGKWHGPAASIHFLTRAFDKQTAQQTLWLRDIRITPRRSEGRREQVVRTIRLDDFLKLGENDWGSNAGQEFPGAKVNLTAEKIDGEYALELAGDFTGGGAYVEMRRHYRELEVEAVKAFHVDLMSDNCGLYNIRLIDGTGQVFQRKAFPFTPDGKWHTVTIDPTTFTGAEHWSGANDGQWHHPARMLSIVLTKASSPDDAKPVIHMREMRADVVVPGVVKPASLAEDFEDDDNTWQTEGNVEVADSSGMNESRGLVLTRGENEFNKPTLAAGPEFAAAAGAWEIAGAVKPDLFFRDNSFNGAIGIEWLNRAGEVIDRRDVFLAMKKGPWGLFRERVEAPEKTARGRLTVKLNKTFGKLAVDDLSASYVAAAPAERRITAIKMWSERPGNLFYPEDKPTMRLRLVASKPLSRQQQNASVVVRDYWGGELGRPIPVAVSFAERQKNLLTFDGEFDLSSFPIEVGAYYEVHVDIPREGAEPYRDFTTLAVLPEAPAKKHPPRAVPFTSRNWDNRIREYAVLSDRLGIRAYGIWSDWAAKPPHKLSLPGARWAEEFDMGIVARTPVHKIERHLTGYEDYTPESLHEGAKRMVEALGERIAYVSSGNEPHGDYDKVKENVAAYAAVYEGVKAANPDLPVIGTSVGPEEDYFRAGFQESQDIYDFHTYEDYRRIRRLFARYNELFEKYGGRKPICSTELGLNSQGQTRRAVAISLIKKLTVFFEQGGQSCSWFGLLYPDPNGDKESSAGQSHNVFISRYRLYAPKLDAIAYYNMVNGICVKQFREMKRSGDNEAYLFVDDEDNCLQVIWNDVARDEAFVPLPGVPSVTVIRIDGSFRELNPAGKGISIDVSTEPVLLLYEQTDARLSERVFEPALRLTSRLRPAVKGSPYEIEVSTSGVSANGLEVEGPRGWPIERKQLDAGRISITMTVPETTAAREARLRVTSKKGPQGELYLGVPLAGRLQTTVRPVADAGDGEPGVSISIRNNGAEPEEVSWSLDLTRVLPMAGGTFNLSASESPTAYFSAPAAGVAKIAGYGEFTETIPLADVDSKLIYAVQSSVTDSQGRTVEWERYIGGFARVPRAKQPLTLDGSLDEGDWRRASVQHIDEERQFYEFKKLATADWTGEDDLSATVRFLWDDKHLYLGVEVTDDSFNNPSQDGAIWRQDGLQLLVDPARAEEVKKGKYDYVLGVGRKGPQAWCALSANSGLAPGGEAPQIKVTTQHSKDGSGGMIYEVAIPWTRLAPFTPSVGGNLGLSLILNEDDGDGRDSFMGWFSGVHSKQLDMVGDLILGE
jgi:hypothetical protein